MGWTEDREQIGQLIDAFSEQYPACLSFEDEPGQESPPLDMRASTLGPGWGACRVLPSTLTLTDIENLERELGVRFPPFFRNYLTARYHLFDQLHCSAHDNQLVLWPVMPSDQPLALLVQHIQAWSVFLSAAYIPIAEWGDGWGPMCFDTARRDADGDCPVVWMDHELLFEVGTDNCRMRANVESLARPLYGSSRGLILDLFSMP